MVEEQVVQAFHSLWRRFDARHLIQLGSRLVAEQQCRERCDRHFHHMVRLAVGRHTVSFFKEECEAVIVPRKQLILDLKTDTHIRLVRSQA